jgi:hypothetical protein
MMTKKAGKSPPAAKAKTGAVKSSASPAPKAASGKAKPGAMFKRVEPLHPDRHQDLKLLPESDFRFAANVAQIPLTFAEVALACRHYVIVFAPGKDAPRLLALAGLRGKGNVFVEPNGSWRSGHYVPAAIRRYPFTLMATPDKDKMVLALDVESERISKNKGRKLFENGKPSPVIQEASAFLKRLQMESVATDAFTSGLAKAGILKEGRLAFKSPEGKQEGTDRLLMVDEKKLRDLPAETVADWHRKGWLALIHFHLLSMNNAAALMERAPKPH